MKITLHSSLGPLSVLILAWGLTRSAEASGSEPVAEAEIVRVMSFNLWHGGDAGS